MLAEFDAETRFQLRAMRGSSQQARGLALLDKAARPAVSALPMMASLTPRTMRPVPVPRPGDYRDRSPLFRADRRLQLLRGPALALSRIHTLLQALLVCASTALPATAQTAAARGTLDKIRATGTVVLGVSDAGAPMVYALGAQDGYTGYHVELCRRVLQEIAPQARLDYQELTAQNTLALVQNGTVDLVCGATTNNLARQQRVAFSLTTYLSQVRMAVRADSDIRSFAQLAGRTVAATTGTTAVQLVRSYGKAHGIDIPMRLGKDHHDSFLMVDAGRAEAFVLDDNLLAGMIANARDPQHWRITGEVLAAEPIALVFRKDDPAFKQAVDAVLRRLMLSGEAAQLYERWFMAPIPPRGTSLQLPMGETLRQLFRAPNDKPLEAYAR